MKSIFSKSHDLFILLDHLLSLVVFLCPLLAWLTPGNSLAEDDSEDALCCECHKNIYDISLGQESVHLPFFEQRCSFCHVCDDEDIMAGTAEKSGMENEYKYSPQNVSSLDYRVTFSREHWFSVQADPVMNGKLVVSAQDQRGNAHNILLPLPALEVLPLTANDNIPPDLKDVDVLAVYQNVLISACIGWQTDKNADSEVRYGMDDILNNSVRADNFSTDHKVFLHGLEADREYKYKVVSRDIFGNTTESDVASFSTKNLLQRPVYVYEDCPPQNIQLDSQLYRNDNSFIMKFNANIPVVLMLGLETADAPPEDAGTGQVAETVPNHKPMRSEKEISTIVCMKCHTNITHAGNHPINVHPPANAILPDDYFLAPGRFIVCTTCHASHASEYKDRLRFCYRDGNIKAGAFATIEEARSAGGCLVCHTSKGVLPENRRSVASFTLAPDKPINVNIPEKQNGINITVIGLQEVK